MSRREIVNEVFRTRKELEEDLAKVYASNEKLLKELKKEQKERETLALAKEKAEEDLNKAKASIEADLKASKEAEAKAKAANENLQKQINDLQKQIENCSNDGGNNEAVSLDLSGLTEEQKTSIMPMIDKIVELVEDAAVAVNDAEVANNKRARVIKFIRS